MQEKQCRTVWKQQCNTVAEQKCDIVNEQQCSTVNEQQCKTVAKVECNTVNEEVQLFLLFVGWLYHLCLFHLGQLCLATEST